MNFLQLVQRAKRESGRSGGGPTTLASLAGDDARIKDWVADAWVSIQSLPRNWRFMRATALGDVVAGTRQYAPAALGITSHGRWVRPNDSYKPTAYDAANPASEWVLRWLEYDDWRARFTVGEHAAAAPQFWSVAPNGDLLLGPTPDAAYKARIDYLVAPVVLADNTDTPAIAEHLHMVIVWKALQDIAGHDAAPEKFALGAAKYDELLSTLVDEQGERVRIGRHALG